MRVAALYDIHGNLPALEAVLKQIEAAAVDHIVIGGDVVAGPMPAATLTLLQNIPIPTHFIQGNAESEILSHLAGEAIDHLSSRVTEVIQWAANDLTPSQSAFLSTWPLTWQIEIAGWGPVLFCHATPESNTAVFTRHTAEEKLRPLFEPLTASLVVCGHTHMQFDRLIGPVRVVNAGSVGMPFGTTGANWLLIDTKVTFKHTAYDPVQAAHRIRQTAYPHADEFAAHNVLQTPSEAEALAVFTPMEVI